MDNLSVPLILGMPFLVTNSVSCDYAERKCNVLSKNGVINLLEKTPTSFPTLDILSSLHKQALSPEDEHTLSCLEHAM
jgi:hypothetical protein